MAEIQKIAELNRPCKAGKRTRTDDIRANLREIPFGMTGKEIEQKAACHDGKHGVPEEFQTLVRAYSVLLVLIGIGGMAHCLM